MDDIKKRLRLGGEDSSWEFKEIHFKGDKPTAPARNDLVDEIVAFANSTGGYLVCGVRDDQTVQDLSSAQVNALVEMLSEACNDSIKPNLSPPPRITIEDASENTPVVVVNVSKKAWRSTRGEAATGNAVGRQNGRWTAQRLLGYPNNAGSLCTGGTTNKSY